MVLETIHNPWYKILQRGHIHLDLSSYWKGIVMDVTAKLLQEGEPSDAGRIIEPGAITWPETIPVTLQNSDVVIGHAKNIRRQDDGWIVADFTFDTDDDVDLEGVSTFLRNFKATGRDHESFSILEGEIGEVRTPLKRKLVE
jgi:hypothetical protein